MADLKRSWPGAETYFPEPEWDKRQLIHLYKDLSFQGGPENENLNLEFTSEFLSLNKLPRHYTTLEKSTLEHTTHNNKIVCPLNCEVLKETLFWTKKIGATTTEELQEKHKYDLELHFSQCNWFFPLLLGSQHSNRFKRNTKVYVLFGKEKGRHGLVVGHCSGFNLKAWGSGSG